ncbi:MAG: Na+/H+ antiporter subunit E [Lachnospiraceae bacterium]|nr:Na+/H+ antiporter subunit E [Lachnospiraceae bacterium]
MSKTRPSAVIATFILCFGFWLLVTLSLSPRDLVLGAVVCLGAALFSARFFIHEESYHMYNPARIFRFLYYFLIVFMGELVKANWDVAKRALSIRVKVNPGIVKVPSELRREYAQALLANSITLTPGTITMDIVEEDEKVFYYVHWIDVSETDREKAGEAIKGRMEKWIRRIWE